jgi:hypothetical protein
MFSIRKRLTSVVLRFKDWSEGIAKQLGYEVRLLPVGPEDPLVGARELHTAWLSLSNNLSVNRLS